MCTLITYYSAAAYFRGCGCLVEARKESEVTQLCETAQQRQKANGLPEDGAICADIQCELAHVALFAFIIEMLVRLP